MIWEPKYEGNDHINVYSKSALPLGRALSNFFQSTFIHPVHGLFKSVEGYYYWALTGEQHNELRELYGFPAKEFGQKLPKVRKLDKKFKEQIQGAICHKILQNPYIQDLMVKSSLPFAHYYYYGDKDKKPKVQDRSKRDHYMLEALEEIRINLKLKGKIDNGKAKQNSSNPPRERLFGKI